MADVVQLLGHEPKRKAPADFGQVAGAVLEPVAKRRELRAGISFERGEGSVRVLREQDARFLEAFPDRGNEEGEAAALEAEQGARALIGHAAGPCAR